MDSTFPNAAELLAVQIVWPVVYLLLGGIGKSISIVRRDRDDSLVVRLAPTWVRPSVAIGVIAGCELLVALLILAQVPRAEIAAALLLAGAASVAAIGLGRAESADCGCLGAFGRAAVGPRTVARAAVLAAMAAMAAFAPGWTVLLDDPWLWALVGAEGLAMFWLSPELHTGPGAWTHPVARLRCGVRRRRSAQGTLAWLRGSRLWNEAQRHLVEGEPVEHWQEGCWRFLCFPADYDDQSATAVFAVDLAAPHPSGAVAFVDEEHQYILARTLHHDQAANPSPPVSQAPGAPAQL